MSDLISRQAAIDAVRELYIQSQKINNDIVYDMAIDQAHDALINLPSAQSERDTPRKPIETTSRMWGIIEKEPVCPKCGYYLGHWRFQGKRITYCEHCGQAIDWSDWRDGDE